MKRFLKRFPLQWDWYDWSLATIDERWPDGRPKTLTNLFSLLCCECRLFTFGCGRHWFCGLCPTCSLLFELDEL